jgi:hypothetical protein
VLETSCVGLVLRRGTAAKVAEDYLRQKYTCEMRYLATRISWEPSLYRVYFSPVDDPELVVCVVVDRDLSISMGRTNIYGSHFEPDNYLLQLFSLDTKRFFSAKIQEIWDVNTRVHATTGSTPPSFEVPAELNEQMTSKEMEPYLEYDIYISIDLFVTEVIKEKEAANILKSFRIIKDAGYKPNEILFWYKTTKEDREIEERSIRFENWTALLLPSQVIDVIERELQERVGRSVKK